MDIVEKLIEWADVLHIKNLAWDVIREIGWWFIKTLANLCNYLNSAVVKIYDLLGFSNSKFITNFMDDLYPLYTGVLMLSLMFVGFWFIMKKEDSKGNIFQNLVVIILIITCMPAITSKFADLTIAGSDHVRAQYTKKTAAFSIIDDNVIDLLLVDSKTSKDKFSKYSNWNGASGSKINNIDDMGKVKRLDITAYMDYDDGDLVHKDLWKARLTEDSEGEYTEGKMDETFFDVFHDYYYRYHVNWFTVIFSLLAMAIVLFFTCFKAGRIIIEVAVHQVFAAFIALTDIVSGQRIKEFIRSFIALFASLFLIACLLGIYFMGLQYLSNQYSSGIIKDNAFLYVLMQIVLAFAVIDGPALIEKILGTDIGMKSGWQIMAGAAGAAAGASAMGRGAKSFLFGSPWNKGGGVVGGAKKVGKAATKAAVGEDGMQDMKDKTDDVKDKAADKVRGVTGGRGMYGAFKNMAGRVSKDDDSGNAESKSQGSENPGDSKEPNVNQDSPKADTQNPGRSSAIDRDGVDKIRKSDGESRNIKNDPHESMKDTRPKNSTNPPGTTKSNDSQRGPTKNTTPRKPKKL